MAMQVASLTTKPCQPWRPQPSRSAQAQMLMPSNRRLTEELARRVQDKREYEKKIAQGYVVFEGRLIPGDERDRILAERAERQRKEEERRLAEANRRAAAQRKQQEELQRARIHQFVAFVNLASLECPIYRAERKMSIPRCFIDESLRECGYDPQYIWVRVYGTLTFEGEDVPRSLQLSAASSGASNDMVDVWFADKWHPCQLTYVPPRVAVSITVHLNEFEGRVWRKKSLRAQEEDKAAVEKLFRLCVGALDFEYFLQRGIPLAACMAIGVDWRGLVRHGLVDQRRRRFRCCAASTIRTEHLRCEEYAVLLTTLLVLGARIPPAENDARPPTETRRIAWANSPDVLVGIRAINLHIAVRGAVKNVEPGQVRLRIQIEQRLRKAGLTVLADKEAISEEVPMMLTVLLAVSGIDGHEGQPAPDGGRVLGHDHSGRRRRSVPRRAVSDPWCEHVVASALRLCAQRSTRPRGND